MGWEPRAWLLKQQLPTLSGGETLLSGKAAAVCIVPVQLGNLRLQRMLLWKQGGTKVRTRQRHLKWAVEEVKGGMSGNICVTWLEVTRLAIDAEN